MKSTTKKMTTKEDLQTKSIDILVVDDSIASLRLLTEILTKEDLKVRPVREPQLAFMSACAQPPNLILLDVNMPDMSGFELCRRLKADERTHSVPIIFVSAMDDLRERLMGFEAGAVDYITKPIQEAEVLARVNTHLKLRNTQLHLEKLVAERTADLNALLQERTQALIMAEAQIDTLFENSPLGIGLSTFDGKIVAVNQALLDIMRVSKEELLLRNVTDFYVDPAERQTLIAAMLESGFMQNYGIQLRRHDGDLFYASMNLSPLVLQEGKFLLAAIEDISEQIALKEAAAVLEERNRLARDLHDSVTQTLFSARMIAQAIPRIWDKDPASGQQNVEHLSVMVQGALAEMRSFLLELRPNGLTNQSLVKLLEMLGESIRGRTRANVYLLVEGDCFLPDDVTLALYRIAQESLNNVAKHAEAGQIDIKLSCAQGCVTLDIADDGRGFDPQASCPGHMGLKIMEERAQLNGIKTMLSTFDDVSVIGEAGSAAEALVRCQETRPDVILMDVVMPVMNGVETTRAILAKHPHVKIIILTSFPEQEMVQEALEAGAIGFLLKDVSIDILGGAIRSAAAGQSVLSEQATQALIQKSGGQPKLGTDLSSREREVLALVAEGLNNTEIADQLVISPNTVRNHVSTCTSKLGASNRAQAAVLAMKNHLISESRDSSYR